MGNLNLVGTAVQTIGDYTVVIKPHGPKGQVMADVVHQGVFVSSHVRDSAFEATLEAGFTISQHTNKKAAV